MDPKGSQLGWWLVLAVLCYAFLEQQADYVVRGTTTRRAGFTIHAPGTFGHKKLEHACVRRPPTRYIVIHDVIFRCSPPLPTSPVIHPTIDVSNVRTNWCCAIPGSERRDLGQWSTDDCCIVCFGDYSRGDRLCRLPCRHVYHAQVGMRRSNHGGRSGMERLAVRTCDLLFPFRCRVLYRALRFGTRNGSVGF